MAVMGSSEVFTDEQREAIWGRLISRSWDWDGCFVWEGADNRVGYGQISFQGKRWYTHRLAYTAAYGAIPEGMVLDHLCRNTLCFRPSHLEAVTQQVNTLRGRTGTKTHCNSGHEFDEVNTYITPYGHRFCRKCRALRERSRRLRLFGIGKDHTS